MTSFGIHTYPTKSISLMLEHFLLCLPLLQCELIL